MGSAALSERLVVGLAMPWRVYGVVKGRRARFQPGCLTPVHPNMLLEEHVSSARHGWLADAWFDEAGQWVAYRVRSGLAGDLLLRNAVGRRLSIGMDPDSVVFEPDPDDPQALVVVAASWLETSLTDSPRFPAAHVSEVRL